MKTKGGIVKPVFAVPSCEEFIPGVSFPPLLTNLSAEIQTFAPDRELKFHYWSPIG
jgi:hypothetical protein